jgi:general secretion pathway protein J
MQAAACSLPRAAALCHRPDAGLTLVELLVAITVLLIIAMLGWRGLDGILRSRATLTAQLEQARELQLAFAQLQRDFDNLAPARLLHGQSNLQAGDNRVTLVRTAMAENAATQLVVVAYRVKDGSLIRSEWPATRSLPQLQALWTAALVDQGASAGVTLQRHVGRMAVRYWVDQRWQPAATVGAGANPPRGLALDLTLQDQPSSISRLLLLGNG